jgi:hypothetical protein
VLGRDRAAGCQKQKRGKQKTSKPQDQQEERERERDGRADRTELPGAELITAEMGPTGFLFFLNLKLIRICSLLGKSRERAPEQARAGRQQMELSRWWRMCESESESESGQCVVPDFPSLPF